ncbi:NADH-quinone oxidoreductase subunit N [Tautonia sociabilis]|uniref:NADH-quinone oxidoreductase subunit N n=1 Tax=Tautonia sociabilis TaxID=2080755 RepID=A0A432MHA8_9BACT|nr:NADH-quinone oxidoreductase subunit N [Tautonia sociabilis]RUL86485.1 NADH-quinone oxidoreductase subunit N [Tautonia sociabilis]
MPPSSPPPIDFSQLWALSPEILLTLWGLVLLLVDVGPLRGRPGSSRRKTVGSLALIGPIGVFALLLAPLVAGPGAGGGDPDPTLVYGTIAGDPLATSFNGVIALLLAMVIGMSMAWDFTEHWGAYFALLLWAAVGMMVLVAAEELLILFLALELMTICLYLAAAFEKDKRRSAEAGMKYFVYGSVASALFLFGLSLLYGLTGTTFLDGIRRVLVESAAATGEAGGLSGDLVGATAVLLILVGFGFKLAAVPFHQWAPDTYEGAPAPVSAWIASGSKLASLVALMKVLLHALAPWAGAVGGEAGGGWVLIVAAIAAATMTYGNLAALAQRNLKRMLAYSSIAHAGYMLVGVLAAMVTVRSGSSAAEAAGAVLFYLVIYSLTTVGAFAAAAWLARGLGRDDIDDLDGLGVRSPGLAVCLAILMLSLIGLPPTAGFVSKLAMFLEVLNADASARSTLLLLVALALVNSVISAFYYARVLRALFLRRSDRSPGPAPRGVSWPIVLAALAAVGFGLEPAPLVDSMRSAASAMLTITLPPSPPDLPAPAPVAAIPVSGGMAMQK